MHLMMPTLALTEHARHRGAMPDLNTLAAKAYASAQRVVRKWLPGRTLPRVCRTDTPRFMDAHHYAKFSDSDA